MVTSNPLNKILRGLMRRSSEIGKVYVGTQLVETVASKAGTIVSDVTVPAGTYVVTGCVSWNKDNGTVTVYSIDVGESRSKVAEARGTMVAGGGECMSAIVTVGGETKLRLVAYHEAGSTIPLSMVSLQAVKIK